MLWPLLDVLGNDVREGLTLAGCRWCSTWQGDGPGPRAIQAGTPQVPCPHWHHSQIQSPHLHPPPLKQRQCTVQWGKIKQICQFLTKE